jgi:tetratricopeptide (TPR) repeat protein
VTTRDHLIDVLAAEFDETRGEMRDRFEATGALVTAQSEQTRAENRELHEQTQASNRDEHERTRDEIGALRIDIQSLGITQQHRTIDRNRRIFELLHFSNPHLVGRDGLLDTVERQLTPKESHPRIAVLWGLGGVGKTQVASAYAYRRADDTDVVWWVQAQSEATIIGDYVALGRVLGLPEAGIEDQAEVATIVIHWLEQSNLSWLLIFDNAEHHDAIHRFIPGLGNGQVIVTSTSPDWGAMASRRYRVRELSTEHAANYLEMRCGFGHRASAEKLAAALGGLPLALAQAAAFMDTTGTSIAGYVDLFTEHRMRVLDAPGAPVDHRLTVTATWEVALMRVREQSPAAIELLSLCAFLAPERIPIDLMAAHRDVLPNHLQVALADKFAMTLTVGALHAYSFAEIVDDRAISIHRLVQEAARNQLDTEERIAWRSFAVHVIDAAFPHDARDPREWETCARLLSHAEMATSYLDGLGAGGEVNQATGNLLERVGWYLRERALFGDARKAFERALSIVEMVHGPDHPDVAIQLNNLAGVLRDQGDYAGARERFERALAIGERTLGPDHPDVAIRLSNLALVFEEGGDPLASAQIRWRLLSTMRQHPPSYAEGVAFHRLGGLAFALDRPESGLGLLAATYIIDHRLGHTDAEQRDLPEIRRVAEALGLNDDDLNALLAGVSDAYQRDRGRGLVAAAFPELSIET